MANKGEFTMKEKVLVEVSARHIHLSQEHLEKLFGEGHELTVKKMLSQPGQYACDEKVTLKGAKGEMKVSVLGPVRKETQVELSLTDARTLGVKAAIRESGDIEGTAGLVMVGPAGEVELEKGVIAAKRHIHMTTKDAEYYGVTNGQIVGVKVETDGRSVVFGDTVVRVSDSYALAMHIDTDESNAAAIAGSAMGEIVL
jgi:putative phosphotransacetylase